MAFFRLFVHVPCIYLRHLTQYRVSAIVINDLVVYEKKSKQLMEFDFAKPQTKKENQSNEKQ